MTDFNKLGYDWSDADLASRLPGLVQGRTAAINDTYNAFNGPLDPTTQNSFLRTGLEGSAAALGGGNGMAGIGDEGSAGRNAVAATLGNEVEQKQNQDWTNRMQLEADNPLRLGLGGITGEQYLGLKLGNAQAMNDYNVAKYQFQTQKKASDSGGI